MCVEGWALVVAVVLVVLVWAETREEEQQEWACKQHNNSQAHLYTCTHWP